ncbi:MAG: hypothetical protein Kow00121_36860 [Elainellaceae cyanobacterium]
MASQIRWQKPVRWVALFLVGLFSQVLLLSIPGCLMAQPSPPSNCGELVAPLTTEEETYARAAWQYFVTNYQPATGFTNAAGDYPSGTLWDMGNYLMALNSARWLNLIDQSEFDAKLNQFLNGLVNLKLFEETLPNKVYNTATSEIVDYGNNPIERGIGWSALDLGRMLAAFHVVRTCHPQYSDWLSGIVSSWNVDRSLQEGQLYGATVTPEQQTLLVQEGRLGYEEYAARGYQLWGFDASKALDMQPMQFVEIEGIQIPVDVRDYRNSGANNYVVSESYILDGIEFGLEGNFADYASRVLEVQKRRYESTGHLTAVSEDNIDQAPYFLYNTVYANGVPWAVITDTNQLHPQLRTLSTKAAFGWRYLYPTNAYAQKIFEPVKNLYNAEKGGYYAGIYEETGKTNEILTGNTNGLILEILYYKARGNRPLIESAAAASTASIAPIPAVDSEPSPCSEPEQPLSSAEQEYARAAWQYFATNVQDTGLVNDRSDMRGVTAWGMGDYGMALHAARSLNLISAEQFDQQVRQFVASLQALPLYAQELPNRAYNPLSLQATDYGGNPSGGTGWSSLDIGRLLTALHTLKTCHPAYAQTIDDVVLNWSYLRIVREGQLFSAKVVPMAQGRSRLQITPETRLGYEEYAARALQLWGFDANQSAVGGDYQTTEVEGNVVPVQRSRATRVSGTSQYTVVDPFIVYGLEFGFDPQMRSFMQSILQAETARHQRTGLLTTSSTTLNSQAPYVAHNTLVGQGQPWAVLDSNETVISGDRTVSSAVAFAYHALFPNDAYSQQLWQAAVNSYNPVAGYYEGLNERTGEPVMAFSSSTNSLILESLLYATSSSNPVVHVSQNPQSSWWRTIEQGDSGQGLPRSTAPQVQFTTDSSGSYWSSQSIPVAEAPVREAAAPPIASTAPAPAHSRPLAAIPASVATPSLSESDHIAAQRAWNYFQRNWNQQTGFVNAVDQMNWTTLWDQGSAILGMHAAHQLGLLPEAEFQDWISQLLQTLETLPLPSTGLPNKAYSTTTAEMRQLDNTPDPNGTSGWSVLDTARLLSALHVLQSQYPEHHDRIAKVVDRWNLERLVKAGWLNGGISSHAGIQEVQEGRLGYEQYAAESLRLWGITAEQALNHPPTTSVQVEGVTLAVDQRDFANSGASNYLTSDPYLLWGLELGWSEAAQAQANALLQVQAKRFERTNILTAVNEDSIDRPPYFLYYSVYANGQFWNPTSAHGDSYPEFRFLSTKAAFGWGALMPDHAYAKTLRDTVQNLADVNRGYLSGRYEDEQLGVNRSIDINTNAIVLESLLYQARGRLPLVS